LSWRFAPHFRPAFSGVKYCMTVLAGHCEADRECSYGRKPYEENPLCGECLDDFSASIWSDMCVYCPEPNVGMVVALVGMLRAEPMLLSLSNYCLIDSQRTISYSCSSNINSRRHQAAQTKVIARMHREHCLHSLSLPCP